MKKVFTMLMVMLMVFSFAGCSSNSRDNAVQDNKKEEETTEDPSASVLREYAGNYRLKSIIQNGEEKLTEEMKAQAEELGLN